MIEQIHVFDTNLQKELLSKYEGNSKNKSQEYTKFLANKKTLIRIIFGQYNKVTKTETALGAIYAANCQARNSSGSSINYK